MHHPHRLGRALAALCIVLSATAALAAAKDDPTAAIRTAIQRSFPSAKVEDVRPAPVPGLYEVFTGNQLVYADASGDHLFVGQLLDTRNKTDLAEEALQERLKIDFDSLPIDKAIRIVKGTGARRLAIFEDPDCPYCQRLEKQIAGIDNVTLYVFLFPLIDLHAQARARAHDIWCSPDRAASWTHWMQERKAPPAAADSCTSDPVDELTTIALDMHVDSTPTLFFPDGRRAKGAFEAAQLNAMIDSHLSAPPKAAAAKAAGTGTREGGSGRTATAIVVGAGPTPRS